MASASAFGEGNIISVGVKGGVPITDAFETAKGNSSFYATNTKRYVVGPTFELHLPARLSIEVDALYTRLGFDRGVTNASGAVIDYSTTRANSWVFPVLAKWEILPGAFRPFVDAGASFRNISGVKQVRSVVSGATLNNVTLNNAPEFSKRNDVGATFGFGLAFKAGPVRISPEFRYTRWGSENFRDPVSTLLSTNKNDGAFLLGLTF